MNNLNLDDLLGTPEPLLSFTYKNKTYEILKPDNLPERFYLRLMAANADLADLDARLASPSNSDLLRIQAEMLTPTRKLIESMACMKPDSLIDLTSDVVMQLYKAINEALKPAEQEAEQEQDEPEEKKSDTENS